MGQVVEISPNCLLDFDVSEKFQRNGYGYALFSSMLEITSVPVHKIAYDRPSPKLISFMKKYFSLTNMDLQPNRYAIFEGFFDEEVRK